MIHSLAVADNLGSAVGLENFKYKENSYPGYWGSRFLKNAGNFPSDYMCNLIFTTLKTSNLVQVLNSRMGMKRSQNEKLFFCVYYEVYNQLICRYLNERNSNYDD
jgi:hypothetical protein